MAFGLDARQRRSRTSVEMTRKGTKGNIVKVELKQKVSNLGTEMLIRERIHSDNRRRNSHSRNQRGKASQQIYCMPSSYLTDFEERGLKLKPNVGDITPAQPLAKPCQLS